MLETAYSGYSYYMQGRDNMCNELITLVIPVYNEEQKLFDNIKFIHEYLNFKGILHNFILIDDGSKDNTWTIIGNLSKSLECVTGLRLSRNFGKESALCAGLDHVESKACIVMDSDLQHPPHVILQMIEKWQTEGYQVVEAVKTSRGKESLVNKIGASLFYDLLKRTSGYNLKNASDYKLLDKRVVDAWKSLSEKNTFFRGLTSWVGFKHTTIAFSVEERAAGKTKWSVIKLARLAINAITSFSSIPLQIVTFFGILFMIAAIILGVQTLYNKISGQAVSGFTTVILLQLVTGSSVMLSLGIIGTYIAKIFDEVKNRPRYIISERTKLD